VTRAQVLRAIRLVWQRCPMPAPEDSYPAVLRDLASALIQHDHSGAAAVMDSIRFTPQAPAIEKWPTRSIIAKVYLRDRYQCRYCGAKVILTPVMRLIARLFPEEFPYHPNWKADSTHPAFAATSATLDHVIPIAEGGDPLAQDNLVTSCWRCNRRKSDLRLDEIGWTLAEPIDKSWMGLAELFNPLWEAAGQPELGEDERWWLRATRELSL
jgi:5-methylcytosine-specific restriction endonuclease McrA